MHLFILFSYLSISPPKSSQLYNYMKRIVGRSVCISLENRMGESFTDHALEVRRTEETDIRK